MADNEEPKEDGSERPYRDEKAKRSHHRSGGGRSPKTRSRKESSGGGDKTHRTNRSRTRHGKGEKPRAKSLKSSSTNSRSRSNDSMHSKSSKRNARSRSRAEQEQAEKRKAKAGSSSSATPNNPSSKIYSAEDIEAKSRERAMRMSAVLHDDDDEGESENFLSPEEIHDQRTKLSAKSSGSTGSSRPGAYSASENSSRTAAKSRRQRNSSGETLNLRDLRMSFMTNGGDDDEGDFLSPAEIQDQRSKLRAKTGAAGRTRKKKKPGVPKIRSQREPVRTAPQSAGAVVELEATAVNEISLEEDESKRILDLEKNNLSLQRQMEEIARNENDNTTANPNGADESAPDTEDKPRCSTRRWFIIVGVALLVVVGATVAGIILGGGDGGGADNITGNTTTDAPPSNVTVVPPTATPTLDPTEMLPLYNPPTLEDCMAMSTGSVVEGQGTMLSKNFTIDLDVSLFADTSPELLEPKLQTKIQSVLVPQMAGCSDISTRRRVGTEKKKNRRTLDIENYVIGNGLVKVVCNNDAENSSCEETAQQPCYRCSTVLELFMKEDERILNLLAIITEVFAADFSLTTALELDTPFQNVVAVSVDSGTPTDAPTPSPTRLASESPTIRPSTLPTGLPSSRPTMAPFPFPTTAAPTKIPSSAPTTRSPSRSPTRNPTPAPTRETTPRPTPNPTPNPTPEPTPNPTPEPTPSPTLDQTTSPTPPPFPDFLTAPPSFSTFDDCSIDAYFHDASYALDPVLGDSNYTVVCQPSFFTTIMAVVFDTSMDCYRCVGILKVEEYGYACIVDFQLFKPVPSEDTLYYGYASSFGNDHLAAAGCPSLDFRGGYGGLPSLLDDDFFPF